MLKRLQPVGDRYEYVIPGGAWDRHVRGYIAKRDGDQVTAEKLAAEAQRIAAEQDRALAGILNKRRPVTTEPPRELAENRAISGS